MPGSMNSSNAARKKLDVDYWKRTRNGVKAKLIESFRNGKRQAQGLPTQ